MPDWWCQLPFSREKKKALDLFYVKGDKLGQNMPYFMRLMIQNLLPNKNKIMNMKRVVGLDILKEMIKNAPLNCFKIDREYL